VRGSVSRVHVVESGHLKASWRVRTDDILLADAAALLGPALRHLHPEGEIALARLREGEGRQRTVCEAG
jgi:hypothetical protein